MKYAQNNENVWGRNQNQKKQRQWHNKKQKETLKHKKSFNPEIRRN